MVRCRTWKCTERHRQLIDRIMSNIPAKFQLNYEEVKLRAKPHITEKEWKDWRKRRNHE